jgi:hypothetical protein
VTVEPGIVLDHLNAHLKKTGLWYPVDVSTAAQATLGGMAGNNSCGSRSIAYGNMVHNVLGAEAWTSDGQLHTFGRFEQATGEARRLGERVRELALALQPEIEARWPKVLRRVAGYNLDVFHNQNEKPYTADGSVNLAAPAGGQRGHAGADEVAQAAAVGTARGQGAGRGQLPDLLQGDGLGAAHRQARRRRNAHRGRTGGPHR